LLAAAISIAAIMPQGSCSGKARDGYGCYAYFRKAE